MLPVFNTINDAIAAIRVHDGSTGEGLELVLTYPQDSNKPEMEKWARPANAINMVANHDLFDQENGELRGFIAAWQVEDSINEFKVVYTASVGWPGNKEFLNLP